MNVLDLSGYDALVDSTPSSDWVGVVILILGMAGGVVALTAGLALCFYNEKDHHLLTAQAWERILFGVIVAIILGYLLALFTPKPDTPSFASYVEDAYGFSSSSLPNAKPKDGSLPVTWKQDGEIHSGTLNLLDNELSIKETGGDYLEVER